MSPAPFVLADVAFIALHLLYTIPPLCLNSPLLYSRRRAHRMERHRVVLGRCDCCRHWHRGHVRDTSGALRRAGDGILPVPFVHHFGGVGGVNLPRGGGW